MFEYILVKKPKIKKCLYCKKTNSKYFYCNICKKNNICKKCNKKYNYCKKCNSINHDSINNIIINLLK